MSETKETISEALRVAQRYQALYMGVQIISIDTFFESLIIRHFPADEKGELLPDEEDGKLCKMIRFNFQSWDSADTLDAELTNMINYFKALES